jgi:hypothetical protein
MTVWGLVLHDARIADHKLHTADTPVPSLQGGRWHAGAVIRAANSPKTPRASSAVPIGHPRSLWHGLFLAVIAMVLNGALWAVGDESRTRMLPPAGNLELFCFERCVPIARQTTTKRLSARRRGVGAFHHAASF